MLEVNLPASSLDPLIGVLGDDTELPTDLAEHHDIYLYPSTRAE